MKIIIKTLSVSFLYMASVIHVQAGDDTDIYFPSESASTSQNVLFVMDVSGSMRREVGSSGITRFDAMKAAFNDILNTVPPSLNVGLMNFGSIGSERNNFAQGVKFPISPLTANARTIIEEGLPLNNDGSVNWNANNMPEPAAVQTVFDFLPNITDSWSPQGWTPLVDSLYEAALYFRGEKVGWGVGPLEENGNEWVAHPATYTGSPGGWNAESCDTVWTERLPQGIIPAEYRCPADPGNPASPGTYANCAATATECIAVTGGGGTEQASNSAIRETWHGYWVEDEWDNSSGRKWNNQPGNNPVYTFTVTTSGWVEVYLESWSNQDDAYLWLVYPDGSRVFDDDSGSGRDSWLGKNLAPGEYTIYAATYNTGDNGGFGIWVEGYVSNLKRADDGYTLFEVGGEWTSGGGQNTTSTDNQYYYFTVTEAGTVKITLNEDGQTDPYLYLLDLDGNILAQDDNSASDDDAKFSINLSPGTYKIAAATTDNTIGNSGTFTIEVEGFIGEFPYNGEITTSLSSETQFVKFVSLSAHDDDPWTSVAEISLIDDANIALDKALWSLLSTDSEETDHVYRPATHAFDNDSSSIWHTQWYNSDPVHPHEMIIDLGAAHTLTEFRHLPRQDGGDNGRTNAYEIYLSADGTNWGPAIAGNFIDNASEQTVALPLNSTGGGTGSGTGTGAGNKVAICHIPPGNPDNAHTLVVDVSAVPAHEAHGDLIGACGSGISSEGNVEGTCLYSMCSGAATTEPTYISPIKSECQSNAIILLSDGSPQAGSSVTVNATYDKVVTNNEWTGGLADAFRNLSCDDSPNGFLRGKCGSELTSFLATNDNSTDFDGDQTIQTYTVGLGLGQGSDAENYLKSLSSVDDPNTAGVIEGYYSAADKATLITAFSEILTELELNASTTAFSNPGYSIVTKTSLSHEDTVFIPTFEVGPNAVWNGNLKKYKLVNADGKRKIRGKNDQNAVTELGVFTVGAIDYWSDSTIPDGIDVTKGGVASRLNPAARNLYSDLTCSTDCDLTLDANALSLNNVRTNHGNGNGSKISNSDLGIQGADNNTANTNDRKKYLCFIQGYETYDPERGRRNRRGECVGSARKHMGDMLHFEPVVVTYNQEHDDKDDSTHRQVVFTGTNEGYLHAFDTDSGEELFAFMPRELLKNIKPQFDDNEYRGHKYGIDGFARIWMNDTHGEVGVIDADEGDHVYLYFGLRRGGHSYYALDVTDPTSPILKWKIQGGSGNFQYLGESWSKPYLARLHNGTGVDAPLIDVLIFTGGNDVEATEDITEGADVIIVNATTGEFIWSIRKGYDGTPGVSNHADLTHSIPGGVRILDMDKDGAIDRMYFADLGGKVWRLELDTDKYDEAETPNETRYNLNEAKLVPLASLAGADAIQRKLYNEPDVSLTRKYGQTSLLVSIGSGDRTAPLGTDVTDRFYVLVDRYVRTARPADEMISEDDLAAVTMGATDEGAITLSNELSTSTDENGETTVTNRSVLSTDYEGWYFQFSGGGEKVLSNSLTNHGKVIFTTLVPDVYANTSPSSGACSIPATQGRAYVLDILEGNPTVDLNGSGGNPNNNDLFTVVSANEIPGQVQLVFNEPASLDGGECVAENCIQNVDVRSGKKLSQILNYNGGVLESVFWNKPQE